MFALFKTKNILDEGTTQWLFDCFRWALENFDARLFQQQTQLILANDHFFPDKATSPDETANLLLQRMLEYSAMQQWPCRAHPVQSQADTPPAPHIHIENALRGPLAKISTEGNEWIEIPYDPNALRQPDALIAALAQNLAILLGRAIPVSPPGGEDLRGAATDLLAIFLGFGLFITNNAFNIKRGCGGCGTTPSVQMMGELTEEQMCYALAIFCHLKGIDNQAVLPHLKKTLHKLFKRARKEIHRQPQELSRLDAAIRLQITENQTIN